MNEYLISVDIGTQGTKAALFDRELRMVDTAFEPSTLHIAQARCRLAGAG